MKYLHALFTQKRHIVIASLSFFFISIIGQTSEPFHNDYFYEDFNGSSVDNSIWHIATWSEHGGQTGIERCYVENGFLNMVFINDSQNGFLSAAIQSRDEFLYGKWEARIKPSNVPGLLNSFYTIDWNNTIDESSTSNGTKEEIDIEFLTKSFTGTDGEVHFAVHASNKTSFNTNPDITLGFDPSDDFHIWGFEITPEYIEWFVDNNVLKRYTYADNDISITSPYQLKLNVWSAVNWIGGPPESDIECIYQIDWIKFTPYGSSYVSSIPKNNLNSQAAYPNPFTHTSVIEYTLNQASSVKFLLFNSSGQLVKFNEYHNLNIGKHSYTIDASQLKPGIYFYSLITNFDKLHGKCIVVK